MMVLDNLVGNIGMFVICFTKAVKENSFYNKIRNFLQEIGILLEAIFGDS